MFLFGKSKRNDPKALRSGTVEREPSRMFAIPSDPAAILNREELWNRLHDTDELAFGQTQEAPFTVTYKGTEYLFDTADVEFGVEEDDPAIGALNEKERGVVLNATHAFGVEIKLLDMLVPDMAALFDSNAYRAHSGRWAKMTAGSKVAPSPDYMFTIHAVNDSENRQGNTLLDNFELHKAEGTSVDVGTYPVRWNHYQIFQKGHAPGQEDYHYQGPVVRNVHL